MAVYINPSPMFARTRKYDGVSLI